MADRKLIELLVGDGELLPIEAISLVHDPAIEENWVAFSKGQNTRMVSLATVDEDKRTLIGPALIPDKHIPRYDEGTDEEYDVFFSKDTVKLASELYMKNNRTNEHTLEHQEPIDGVHVVESWIVDNPDMDKSKAYGLSMPEGTWMVRVHVANDEMWKKVKAGEIRGFSIEGYFIDSVVEMNRQKLAEDSYSDYPEAAKNNAKRALKWAEENGWGSCGTDVGKQRANQLASGESLSLETVKRTYSYLSRAADSADTPYEEGCGKLMYDAWGGKSMLNWAEGKVNAAKKTEASKQEKRMKDKLWNAVKSLFSRRQFYTEVTLDDGVVIATEDDTMGAGAKVVQINDEGQPVDLKNGKYKTQNGVELEAYDGVLIEWDGQVSSVEETQSEAENDEKTELNADKVRFYKAYMKAKMRQRFGYFKH